MAINKVCRGNTTLLDLSNDTVASAGDIVNGKVGHLRDGTQVTGTASSGTDTSDATALASDIVSGKSAYIASGKANGTFAPQTKSATPSTSAQEVTPDSGKWLSKVTVGEIPSQYIVPTGTKSISSNGTHDVTNYASVSVNVATPTGMLRYATGSKTPSSDSNTFSVSGITGQDGVAFTPKFIMVYRGFSGGGTSSDNLCFAVCAHVESTTASHSMAFGLSGSSERVMPNGGSNSSKITLSASSGSFSVTTAPSSNNGTKFGAKSYRWAAFG